MNTLTLLGRCVRPVYEALRQSVTRTVGGATPARRSFASSMERLEGRTFLSGSGGGNLLDPTFGTSGVASLDIAGRADLGHAVAIGRDGRTLVAGVAELDDGFRHGVLVRLNADGSRDATFGAAGLAASPFVVGPSGATIFVQDFTALTVQHDGKVIAAGEARAVAGGSSFAAVRYNPDGTLDPTFGIGGVALADFGPAADTAARVGVGPGGRVVVVGRVNQQGTGDLGDFGVARFTRDGVLDTTFNGTGTLTLNFTVGTLGGIDSADALAFTADGKLLVGGSVLNVSAAGTVDRGYALVRLEANGTFDATFGAGGRVLNSNGGELTDLAVAADGKIWVCGNAGGVMVGRFLSNGAADATFGTGGTTVLAGGPLANLSGVEYRLTTLADGTVAVTGAFARVGQVRVFDAAGGVVRAADVTAAGEEDIAVALGTDGTWVTVGSKHRGSVAPSGFDTGAWSAWQATADVVVSRYTLGGQYAAAGAFEFDLLPDVTPAPLPDVTPTPTPSPAPTPDGTPDGQTDVTPTPIDAPAVTAVFGGKTVVKNGRSYKFTVTYSSAAALSSAVVGGTVRIDGPNGYAAVAQPMKSKATKDGHGATVVFQVAAPGGTFDAADNGTYAIEMESGVAVDVPNRARSLVTGSRGGVLLGWFDVTAASRARKGGPVAAAAATPTVGDAGKGGKPTIAAEVLGHA